MANEALTKLDKDFNELQADWGRASIPHEKLLRVQLLMEQINYILLFR